QYRTAGLEQRGHHARTDATAGADHQYLGSKRPGHGIFSPATGIIPSVRPWRQRRVAGRERPPCCSLRGTVNSRKCPRGLLSPSIGGYKSLSVLDASEGKNRSLRRRTSMAALHRFWDGCEITPRIRT